MKRKSKKAKVITTPSDPFKQKGKYKSKTSVQTRKKDREQGVWYPNRKKI